MAKRKRDVEREYRKSEFVAKLRRLADAVEQGGRFAIRIGGERILVPARARFTVEHERSADEEEIELQVKWSTVEDARPSSGAARTSNAKRGAAKRARGRGARSTRVSGKERARRP